MLDTGFTFNNIHSSTYDVSLCRLSSGLPRTKFMGGVQILETHPDNALYPYYHGKKYKPLSFRIAITCPDGGMTHEKMYDIAKWLTVDEYKPFIADDNTGRMYYCMCINEADFITNGLNEGYVELEFRCRDGFAWTIPTFITHDLSTITTATTIQVANHSNVKQYHYPNVQITLESTNTAVSIVNLSDGGHTFSFTGLSVGEVLEVDNDKKRIESDTADNRFPEWNKNWLRLKYGVNNLQVTGKCTLVFRMQFPIYQS